MTNKTLVQTDIKFNKKYFEITESGISISVKKMFSTKSYSVKFEDLGFKRLQSKHSKGGWLIAAIIFIILAIILFFLEKNGNDTDRGAFVVYIVLSIISFIMYFTSYKNTFFLTNTDNTNGIEFLADKPNKIQVEEFVANLKKERDLFLINRYGQMTKFLSYEQQFNTLIWLNRTEALSKDEYEKKLEELQLLFYQPTAISGFQNRQ